MYSNKELCEKIKGLYPEIGECGMDLAVQHDEQKQVWVVDLKKDNQELKHYLEPSDADACMEGKQCVALGLDIAQLRKNIQGKQF